MICNFKSLTLSTSRIRIAKCAVLRLLPPANTMDLQDAQNTFARWLDNAAKRFQKMPGSAIILRYIKSSYQNDPVRSAIELFLFLFAVRYLLAPKYSTQKQKHVALTEDVRTYLAQMGERTWAYG